jgi:flagellar biosynthetic protein FliO
MLVALTLAQVPDASYGVDGSMVRAFLGLAFVLGLIALLAYLLRRGVIALPGQRGAKSLAIESSLALGERRSIVIVNVEGRRLLLALSPAQVSVLSELGATPAFQSALDQATGTPTGRTS